MLKKERQKKYFDKVWKSMLVHLQKFTKTKDPEELHRMRVEMKKFQAHILFTRGNSKMKKLSKHFKPVKTIFKHGGAIRKANVNLKLVEKYRLTNKSFESRQKEIFAIQSQLFYLKYSTYDDTIKHAAGKISRDFEDIRSKFILNSYKKDLKKMARFFNHPENVAAKLHIYRKKIKVLLHTYKLLPESITDKLHLNIAYLDKLQHNIGLWHDDHLASKLLKTNGFRDERVIVALEKQEHELLLTIHSLSRNFAEKALLPDKKPPIKTKVKPAKAT